MFQSAALSQNLERQTYEELEPEVRERLLKAQLRLVDDKSFSLLILITGIDGAGKGEAISRLYDWMDVHYLACNAYSDASEDERLRPPMWRYWRDLPAAGTSAIVFGSWYQEPMRDRVLGRIDETAFELALDDINRFEEMLSNENVLLLKFWFALTLEEQRRRLARISKKHPGRHVLSEWSGIRFNRPAGEVAETVARRTSTGHAPWFVVPSEKPRYRDLAFAQTIALGLERRLAAPTAHELAAPAGLGDLPHLTAIDALDLSARLGKRVYGKELIEQLARLRALSEGKAFTKKALIVLFEGNDAAGKGGCIRRIIRALDPRHFKVHSIAAPTDEEKARPYLWRFWRRIPRKGHIAIFDRSWYGRVLVERVEGLCTPSDWLRAYNEINAFEWELAQADVVVVKFWLAISQDEQLARFREREQTSYKQHKITDEDWRNRQKWPDYARAAGDMVDRTSTGHAPWILIAAEDKRHARVAVLKSLCDRLEELA